jgi:hypothetical protein
MHDISASAKRAGEQEKKKRTGKDINKGKALKILKL